MHIDHNVIDGLFQVAFPYARIDVRQTATKWARFMNTIILIKVFLYIRPLRVNSDCKPFLGTDRKCVYCRQNELVTEVSKYPSVNLTDYILKTKR